MYKDIIIQLPKTSEFKKLVESFEFELKKEGKDESFVKEAKRYLCELFNWSEAIGIKTIIGLKQKHVDSHISYLETQRINLRSGGTLGESTVFKHITMIRNFWAYLEAEGIPYNPIKIRTKRRSPKSESEVLTAEEIKLLYQAIDLTTVLGLRDRAMLALCFGCGLRRSEATNLLLSDIDLQKGQIHVRKTKTKRERYVMMSGAVKKHIEEYIYGGRDFYLGEYNNDQHLLISERGRGIDGQSLKLRLKQLWEQVKLNYSTDKEIGMHTLRHTLGTLLYMGGMDINMVSLMLGHRSLESTQIYVHAANKLKQEK